MFKVREKDRLLEIPELSESESKKHEILGEAEGQNEHHCLYLGAKHGENFFARVVGYRKVPATKKEMKIRVIFYAKTQAKKLKSKKG